MVIIAVGTSIQECYNLWTKFKEKQYLHCLQISTPPPKNLLDYRGEVVTVEAPARPCSCKLASSVTMVMSCATRCDEKDTSPHGILQKSLSLHLIMSNCHVSYDVLMCAVVHLTGAPQRYHGHEGQGQPGELSQVVGDHYLALGPETEPGHQGENKVCH